MSEDRWIPTMSGNSTCYKPQFKHKHDDEWHDVPTVIGKQGDHGIPSPRLNGGVYSQIGMHGHSQAMALAWAFKAQADADGENIQVRAQEYDIVYDIKCREVKAEEEGES